MVSRQSGLGLIDLAQVVFVALGITFAYFFDYGLSFAGGALAWRLPIACQIVVALSVMVLAMGLPETPRYLIQQDRADEAAHVLSRLWALPASDPYIVGEINEILKAKALEMAQPFKWSKILEKDRLQTRWRLFLSVLLLFMNQVSGAISGLMGHI